MDSSWSWRQLASNLVIEGGYNGKRDLSETFAEDLYIEMKYSREGCYLI